MLMLHKGVMDDNKHLKILLVLTKARLAREGGLLKKFTTGGLHPKVLPLNLSYTIVGRKYNFHIPTFH